MAQCPYCMRLFGKLHLRCEWCNVYYCEDCVKPQNHNCLAYDPSKLKPVIYYTHPYDPNICKKFASDEDKVKVTVGDFRSKQEIEAHNEAHITEGNLIYQERIRLGVGRLKDECPICHSELNKVDEKCEYCTIIFCTYCIEPKNHNCVIYRHRNGEFPEPFIHKEIIVEPEIEFVKPDPVKHLISKPVVTVEPSNTTVTQPSVQPVNQPPLENTIKDGKEKKLSLWQRIQSVFGFGN